MPRYKFTFEEIKEMLLNRGYIYIDGEFKGMNSKLVCLDNNGYYVLCNIQKMIYHDKKPRIVDAKNPYSIFNIKRLVEEYTSGEYECISGTYINNNTPLCFRHIECGRTFENKWINIWRDRYFENLSNNKTGLFCPHCNTKQLESTHALILKQVWLHEEPDTIVEEKSCINPNTNCPLPTDIVNHRLKVAIEIQSWFHDFEDKKERDIIKRNFWINNGYDFYAIDQRDYTVLEMIQLFFPLIFEIPNYIDFEYSNKFNDVLAQNLLEEYMSVPKVAEILQCSPHLIYDAIYNNRISYPDKYLNARYTPVVQLDLNKNFIASYDCISSVSDDKKIQSAIAQCLRKGRNYSNGFYWLYKEDYDSDDYIIVESRYKKNN